MGGWLGFRFSIRPNAPELCRTDAHPLSRCTARRTGAAWRSPRLAGRRERRHPRGIPLPAPPRRSTLVSPPGPRSRPYGTVPPPDGPAARAAGLGRGLHDPERLGQQVSPARRRARAAQPPRRPPHPRSARAGSRDVPPRPRSGQLADACRSRVLVSSSLQGGAGPAREGDRPTQVRRRGADNRSAAQRVIQGRAGIVWVAVRPGVSRTATQDQRRQARIAVSSRGLPPGYHVRLHPGPVSLLASLTQPSHSREPICRELVMLKEIGQMRAGGSP